MKSLRSELVRTLVVLSAPLGSLAVFPYAAVGFKANSERRDGMPYVAFVCLTAEEEDAAMRTAKSAWQMEADASRREQAWLPLGELPEEAPGPILPQTGLRTPVVWPHLPYPAPAWKPTAAAPAPVRIAPEPQPERPAFPRKDLLEIH